MTATLNQTEVVLSSEPAALIRPSSMCFVEVLSRLGVVLAPASAAKEVIDG